MHTRALNGPCRNLYYRPEPSGFVRRLMAGFVAMMGHMMVFVPAVRPLPLFGRYITIVVAVQTGEHEARAAHMALVDAPGAMFAVVGVVS